MIVLGINGSSHHNTGAAIVRDGELLAAVEEERFSRIKIDNAYPKQAIQAVLELAGVSFDEVDYLALANLARYEQTPYTDAFYQQIAHLAKHDAALFKYFWKHQFDRYWRRLRGRNKKIPHAGLAQKPSDTVEHHLAHAASAYFPSPFVHERVAVITLDGAGDFSWAAIFLGEQGKLTPIAHYPYVNSIGLLYTAITIYLGFKPSRHEGKVLGLAAYGNPEPLLSRLLAHTQPHNWTQLLHAKLARITLNFHRELGQAGVAELCKGLSKEDIAAGIQAYTEQVICHWIQAQVRQLQVSQLALAGGVFANVKLNQRILALPEVDNIYVHPNMGDGGLATGAAFEVAARHAELNPMFNEQVYLGTEINRHNALQALHARGIAYSEPQDLPAQVAKLLAAGKVVARADGKMEYGPRALGNRSVMAAANDKSINQWLNQQFARTEFMPFAPVILASAAQAYFPDWQATHIAAQFMTLTYKASALAQRNIPAAIHIDGTARPQVLQREQNAKYFDIIFAYGELTGIPSLINTSFNMHEEPIVRTADEAISAFMNAGLDALILGPFLVLRAEK